MKSLLCLCLALGGCMSPWDSGGTATVRPVGESLLWRPRVQAAVDVWNDLLATRCDFVPLEVTPGDHDLAAVPIYLVDPSDWDSVDPCGPHTVAIGCESSGFWSTGSKPGAWVIGNDAALAGWSDFATSTLLHELGHGLGLGHRADDHLSVMQPSTYGIYTPDDADVALAARELGCQT